MTHLNVFRAAAIVSLLLAVQPALLCRQQPASAPGNLGAQQNEPHTIKESFNTVEVDLFENQKDSDFPPEYLTALQEEIISKLASAKVFPEVVAAGHAFSTPNPRVIRLTGLITKYNPGNRAARYFGMGGAGAAEINSKIVFVDKETGQPVMSQSLRAILASGAFGGKSKDAIKDYARQVVNKIKLMQNMRVPRQGDASTSVVLAAEGPVPSSSGGQQETVTIADGDWAGSEQKLNQLAAIGYRLADLTLTSGHTAEAVLVRTDSAADTFQYKLLHTILATNLGKDINKLVAEGFRVSPNTLVVLGNKPVVIVEKSTPPFKSRYEYVLKETQLLSSGQKDIEKIQNQGYTLIAESEHGTAHILLFEKSSLNPTERTLQAEDKK